MNAFLLKIVLMWFFANTAQLTAQAGEENKASKVYLPKLENPLQLDDKWDSKEEVEASLKADTSTAMKFRAGIYYFLNVIDIIEDLDERRGQISNWLTS